VSLSSLTLWVRCVGARRLLSRARSLSNSLSLFHFSLSLRPHALVAQTACTSRLRPHTLIA
jgi:hypothetical protein